MPALRSFAALLAIIPMLAACDGSPVSSGQRLEGSWISAPKAVRADFPDGSRTDQLQVHVTFTADHRYQLSEAMYDPQLGREFVDYASQGTYSVRDDRLTLNLEQVYVRDTRTTEVTGSPTLRPFTGTADFGYNLRDGVLMVNWCSMGEYCPQNLITYHTRAN